MDKQAGKMTSLILTLHHWGVSVKPAGSCKSSCKNRILSIISAFQVSAALLLWEFVSHSFSCCFTKNAMILKILQLMVIDNKVKNALNIEQDLFHRNDRIYICCNNTTLFSALMVACKLPVFETRSNLRPYARKKNKTWPEDINS